MHLKSRLQVAEAGVGQRQNSSAEQDYEEVIQLLEAEITDLKNQLAGKRQTRGAEATKARLELSTLTHSHEETAPFTTLYGFGTVVTEDLTFNTEQMINANPTLTQW